MPQTRADIVTGAVLGLHQNDLTGLQTLYYKKAYEGNPRMSFISEGGNIGTFSIEKNSASPFYLLFFFGWPFINMGDEIIFNFGTELIRCPFALEKASERFGKYNRIKCTEEFLAYVLSHDLERISNARPSTGVSIGFTFCGSKDHSGEDLSRLFKYMLFRIRSESRRMGWM